MSDFETSVWDSPVGHFRLRHKFLSLYADKPQVIAKWLNVKASICDRWFVPFFTPLFFGLTHISQRNRNLLLVENHLNYRPWKFRYNDEGNTY